MKIQISIGVLCVPRDDRLAAQIMLDMAEAAGRQLSKKRARELMAEVQQWIAKNKLGPGSAS